MTYDDGIMMCRKNLPPSYGLPTGPRIDACQCDSWLSNGTASMPSVSSKSSVRMSPRRRFERNGLSACRGICNVIWMRHIWQKHDDISELYICNRNENSFQSVRKRIDSLLQFALTSNQFDTPSMGWNSGHLCLVYFSHIDCGVYMSSILRHRLHTSPTLHSDKSSR